ncbi:MAG: sigma factor-like helix-turn-helix DNA-binding protein [Fimbriimonadaceae bacterium]
MSEREDPFSVACSPASLSQRADALLARCQRDPERPFYRDDTFRSKERASRFRDVRFGFCALARPESPLAESELEGLLACARLTETQEQAVRLRIAGWTLEEIGALRGCTRQAVRNVLGKAASKLRRAMREYPYAGLAEVYRAEVSRRGPRRRDR